MVAEDNLYVLALCRWSIHAAAFSTLPYDE